jgi:hypothetical protein
MRHSSCSRPRSQIDYPFSEDGSVDDGFSPKRASDIWMGLDNLIDVPVIDKRKLSLGKRRKIVILFSSKSPCRSGMSRAG